MKKSLRIIIIGYGLSFIILTIAFLFSRRLNSLLDFSNEIEHTYLVRNQILKIKLYLIQAENNQRGFILLKDSTLLKPLSETQRNIFYELQQLGELIKNNTEQQQILIKLKNDVSRRYQVLYQTIDYAAEGKIESLRISSHNGLEIMEDFQNLALRMEQIALNQLQESEENKRDLEELTPLYLNLVLFISCIFQTLSFIFLFKEFRRSNLYYQQLERKIQELKVSNTELEQIAFVASHDLQEPLRKIRTFSDRLINNHKENLNDEGKLVLGRIAYAASRMQGLIEDLVNFTKISKTEEGLRPVDLNYCLEEAIEQLHEITKVKSAVINIDPLPVIYGYGKQLQLLFVNLIDNALKFTRANISPVINISVSLEAGSSIEPNNKKIETKTFYKISVSDNGIGFDKEFTHKIFIIFQRLHTQNSQYQGKGVGLAICKRVMLNHDGYITATAEQGVGATFNVYFPERTAP
ncbi:MAG: sensor histidine kinase [Chitinophagaceae bacterium]